MTTKKILVCLDDSDNAMRAVEFIAETFAPVHEITLFSVLPDTAAICDMESPSLTPYCVSQKGVFCNLEDKKKQLIHLADEKAREILVTAGFNEKNVKTKTQTTGKGVAGDILKEAAEGYDTIVMGRRGLSGIKEFLLGSVSQKVIHGSKNISLVLVE